MPTSPRPGARFVAPLPLALLSLILLPSGGVAQPTSPAPSTAVRTFANPVVSSGSPDPFIATWKGRYYMTYTTGADVRLRSARSLADLDAAPEDVLWTDAEASRCCNVWAPELHRLQGPDGWRWYVYYAAGTAECCDNQRSFVLESAGDDPKGPYKWRGKLRVPQADFWAIDGTVLNQNGKLYYLWSGGETTTDPPRTQIYIAPMKNPWTIGGSRVELSRATFPWETVERGVNEGPAVLRHGGKFFVTYSGSGCWSDDYAVGLLTASDTANLLDKKSWRKSPTPVLSRDDANEAVAPGHNSFFTSPDGKETWTVYHANDFAGMGCKDGRTARAQKLTWNPDGTFRLGAPAKVGAKLALPGGDPGKGK